MSSARALDLYVCPNDMKVGIRIERVISEASLFSRVKIVGSPIA
jgi:hypothetical protein